MSRTVLDGPKVFRRFQSAFTVVRRAGIGTCVDGNYQGTTSPPVTFSYTGTVTTLKGSERKLLPDGVRVEDVIVVYTASRVWETDRATFHTGDLVNYNGYTYQVFGVEPWNEFGKFWKAMAVRLNS